MPADHKVERARRAPSARRVFIDARPSASAPRDRLASSAHLSGDLHAFTSHFPLKLSLRSYLSLEAISHAQLAGDLHAFTPHFSFKLSLRSYLSRANPLRAGLVERCEDYPGVSSFHAYLTGTDSISTTYFDEDGWRAAGADTEARERFTHTATVPIGRPPSWEGMNDCRRSPSWDHPVFRVMGPGEVASTETDHAAGEELMSRAGGARQRDDVRRVSGVFRSRGSSPSASSAAGRRLAPSA